MELKFCNASYFKSKGYNVLIVPLWNWNQYKEMFSICDEQVLIVPLWNWNCCIKQVMVANVGFNCTFMELK